jgi:hypothetical protein
MQARGIARLPGLPRVTAFLGRKVRRAEALAYDVQRLEQSLSGRMLEPIGVAAVLGVLRSGPSSLPRGSPSKSI